MKVTYLTILLLATYSRSGCRLRGLIPRRCRGILCVGGSNARRLALCGAKRLGACTFSICGKKDSPSLATDKRVTIRSRRRISMLCNASCQVVPSNSCSVSASQLSFTSRRHDGIIALSLSASLVNTTVRTGPRTACILPLCLADRGSSIGTSGDRLFVQVASILAPTVKFASASVRPLSCACKFGARSIRINFNLSASGG